MRLDVATKKDNADLLKFFAQFPQKGLIELRPDRHQNFFGQYAIQSNQYKTYLLRDDDNEIQGMASFIFRDCFSNGKHERIAYAADLRVSHNRRALLEWAKHFIPVMEEVMKEQNIQSIFSAINLNDQTAINTFVRPRVMKRAMPRYFLYRKFNLVSLHGQFWNADTPLPHLRIESGSDQNSDALINYVIKSSSHRPFASVWDQDSFLEKLGRLQGMKLSDFLVAKDFHGNVVGCLAPWSAAGVQDLIPLSYSLLGHNFRQALKFFWLLGLSRRLTKPVASTGEEEPLHFRYLSNIHADNEDIFESLLWTAFKNAQKNEFLVYAHSEQDYRMLPPTTWISASMPYALYAVVGLDQSTPAFLHPSISQNPEIEACFL